MTRKKATQRQVSKPAKQKKQTRARQSKSSGTPSANTLKLLLRLHDLRSHIKLSGLVEEDLGFSSMKQLRRALMSLQDMWQEAFAKDLFEMVDSAGDPWLQGRKEQQYIRRVSEPLDIENVSSLHRRLAALYAMEALLPINNMKIIKDEYKGVAKQIKSKGRRKGPNALVHVEKKFFIKQKGVIDFAPYTNLLDDIYTAVLYSRKLAVTKLKDPMDAPPKVILPLCLISYNSSVYLAAFSEGDQRIPPTVYTHEVTKFRDVKLLTDKFKYPQSFNPKLEFGDRFGLFSGNKNHKIAIQIKAQSNALHHLSERKWGQNQSVTKQADGSHILEFTANTLTEVVPFVLGYGQEITVLQPKELREEVKKTVLGLAQIYL